MIWWLYGGLKEYKLAPNGDQAEILRSRFDRIFKRARTGYVTLNSLLRRLFRNKAQLLLVLERPEIPLNTNAVLTRSRIAIRSTWRLSPDSGRPVSR